MELEFRAWYEGKMYQNVGIKPFSILLYDWEALGNKLAMPKLIEEVGRDLDIKTMQYTNRKDKNDKKIFKDDFIQNPWKSCSGKEIGRTWVVKFGEHSFDDQYGGISSAWGFYAKEINKIYPERRPLNTLPSDDGIIQIGNIHEDKHLIKEII